MNFRKEKTCFNGYELIVKDDTGRKIFDESGKLPDLKKRLDEVFDKKLR